MTTEEILEHLMECGHRFYKKNFRRYCPTIARMLDRKQEISINGQPYRCWQELVVHNIGILIQDYIPHSQCEAVLEMNDSRLLIQELTAEDEKIIMEKLQNLIIETELGARRQ